MTHETPPRPTPATRGTGRLVVLVSGTGSNLAALLAAHDDPAYGARVVAVVADRSGIRALDIAREAGIPTAVVSLKTSTTRPPGTRPSRRRWRCSRRTSWSAPGS